MPMHKGINGVKGNAQKAMYAVEYVKCHGLLVIKKRSQPIQVGEVKDRYTIKKINQFFLSLSAIKIFLKKEIPSEIKDLIKKDIGFSQSGIILRNT